MATDGHEMELSDRLVPVLELSDSEPKSVDSVDSSGVVSVDSTSFPLSVGLGFGVSEGLLLCRFAGRNRRCLGGLGIKAL